MIRDQVPSLVIIDDSVDFLASAGAMLAEEGFDVLACVSDPSEAVEVVERLEPAVVLLDVQLPGADGFELAARLTRLAVAPVVVLVSSRDATSYGSALDAAPIRGFIPKWELSGATLAALV
jgi:CheY-like chemotaxis protein